MTHDELKKVNNKAARSVPKRYLDLGSNLDFYFDGDKILMVDLSFSDLPTLVFDANKAQWDLAKIQ